MNRLFALIIKEFLAIKNDKRAMVIIILPPIIQIIVFTMAISFEVKSVNVGVFLKEDSIQNREFIKGLEAVNFINNLVFLKSSEQGKKLLDDKKIISFLELDKDILMILDGRRASSAQILSGYINNLKAQLSENSENSKSLQASQRQNFSITSRILYNENFDNKRWISVNVYSIVLMVLTLVLTSLSIAREYELGTFEQLLVSPLSPWQMILGKLIAPLSIAFILSILLLFIVHFGFCTPFRGSLLLLLLSNFLFIFDVAMGGLLISAISRTQQQAIFLGLVFLVVSVMISGFAVPVSVMPEFLRFISEFVPLTQQLTITSGVFLKDISLISALLPIFKLVLMAFCFFAITFFIFKLTIQR